MLPYKIFTIVDEARAKKITSSEDFLAGRHRFDGGTRWIGKLGQWLYAELYPDDIENAGDFVCEDFDFTHHLTGEKIEIKTTSGRNDWLPWFSIAMDYDQWLVKPYDLIVFGYYWFAGRKLTLCGWNSRKELVKEQKFYENGETVYSQSNKPMYQVKNKRGCLVWPSGVLRDLEELKYKISES